MAGRTTIVAVLLALVGVAGCVPSAEPTSTAIDGAFPPLGDIAELPFRVADHTGMIRAVSVAEPGDLDETVSQVPGRDDAIFVMWLGGMCDRRVLVAFDGTLNGHAVNVTTDRDFGGCRLAGIQRSLMFEFTEPVDASAVSLSTID